MANLRVIPINFFDSSVNLSATTEVAGMELSNAQLRPRSKFYRSSSNASTVLQGNWDGAGRIVNAFGMFRHNLYGGTYRLQLYSDAAWTTQVYDSTATTVTPVLLGDFDWGIDPLGVSADDPLVYEAPIVTYFGSSSTFTTLSWRITLGGSFGNGSGYGEIGRIWLGKYFQVTTNPDYGMTLGWAQPSSQSRTWGGSLRTASGYQRFRNMTFAFGAISEADRQVWLDMMAQVGTEKDVVVSGFPGVGGRLERDYTINGRFAALNPIEYQIPLSRLQVSITEN